MRTLSILTLILLLFLPCCQSPSGSADTLFGEIAEMKEGGCAIKFGVQPTESQWKRVEELALQFAREHNLKWYKWAERPKLVWTTLDAIIEVSGNAGAQACYISNTNAIWVCEFSSGTDWIHEVAHSKGEEWFDEPISGGICEQFRAYCIRKW